MATPRIIKLDATGTEIPIARNGADISITNGTAVSEQYVSGATETEGAISLTRATLPAGTVSGATDTTFTGLANDDVIQRKSGSFVNRTTDQLLVDLLTGTGNGVLTNTNGILGTTTLPSPPQTGVNPNPTNGRIPLGQGLNADFVDSSLSQTTDTLLTFDATVHHDQGGQDFNIYPTGVLADFIANPTNYDFSVVTSSTTNGTEGFTEIIFDADVVTTGTTVTIENVAAAVAFNQAQITTIRIGTVVPVASGLANFTGLTSWSTTANSVVFVFNSNANALLADTAFSQIQARLTVTSTVDTIQVAAYNANGEGMLSAFLDGRLAEGDRVRFTQRVANLLTHLRVSTDVVNIDKHLIVEGPTSLNGTVNFGDRVTVPEPTDRADAARYLDTWRTAIADSGIRGTTTTQSAGGRTGISVTALTGVENAGPHTNWWIWTGVDLNETEDGFGIAVENVVYSTSGTDPFATGTSAANRPINIQATADQSFHRDVDIANDLLVRGTFSGGSISQSITTRGASLTTTSTTSTYPVGFGFFNIADSNADFIANPSFYVFTNGGTEHQVTGFSTLINQVSFTPALTAAVPPGTAQTFTATISSTAIAGNVSVANDLSAGGDFTTLGSIVGDGMVTINDNIYSQGSLTVGAFETLLWTSNVFNNSGMTTKSWNVSGGAIAIYFTTAPRTRVDLSVYSPGGSNNSYEPFSLVAEGNSSTFTFDIDAFTALNSISSDLDFIYSSGNIIGILLDSDIATFTGVTDFRNWLNTNGQGEVTFTMTVKSTSRLTVAGDSNLSGNVTVGARDTTKNLFTGFTDGTLARVDENTAGAGSLAIPAGTTYRAYGFDDVDDINNVGGDSLVIAVPPSGSINAVEQSLVGGGAPTFNGQSVVSVMVGSILLENLPIRSTAFSSEALVGGNVLFLALTQSQVDALETANEGVDIGLGDAVATRFHYTEDQIELYASAAVPMTGDLTLGGDVTTGSGNTSLTITSAEELYTKVRALATAAVVATASVPSAFSSAALVVSRTLTQGSTSTLYYSVFNTGLTTETLYISTDLTNAIHIKTLQ